METTYIKLFLASSITKLEQERKIFGAAIQKINEVLVHNSYYVYLKVCEHMPNEISLTRKQDDYNAWIPECDYFFLLADTSVGAYTLEEFDCALAACRESNKPEIYIFFKGNCSPEDDSIDSLKRLANESDIKHVIYFSEINQVVYALLEKLSERLHLDISCKNGTMFLEGKPIGL